MVKKEKYADKLINNLFVNLSASNHSGLITMKTIGCLEETNAEATAATQPPGQT